MADLKFSNTNYNIADEEKEFIFEAGTIVAVRHSRILDNMLNIIQKYDEKNIYLRITNELLERTILIGDNISCQIFKGKYEYLIYGRITNININSPNLIQINIDRMCKHSNLRKERRYLTNFRSNFNILDSSNKILTSNVFGIIKNISFTGAGLICYSNINKESILDIKFSSNIIENDIVNFKGKVLRSRLDEGYLEYGLIIIGIDNKNKNLLNSLLLKLENNEKCLFDQ